MAQFYFPFEAGAGSSVSENDWFLMAQWWMQAGVYLEYLNGMEVFADSTGRQVKIRTGLATAYGVTLYNNAEYTLTGFTLNGSGNPRIDVVVARFDWGANTVSFHIEPGSPAASPTPPVLALTPGGVWDLELAYIAIASGYVTIAPGDVTDRRVNAQPRPHSLLDPEHYISGQGVGYPLRTTSGSAFSFGQIGDVALDGSAQRPNLLLNGGFESKIRAAASAATTATLLHDGWELGIAGGETLTVQDTTSVTQNNSQHAALCTVTAAGNGGTVYQQLLRVAPAGGGTGGYYHFRGQTLSLRGLVKQQGATANAVRLYISGDGTGAAGVFSAYHGANTNWETLDAVGYVVPNDATYVAVAAQFMAGTALDVVLDDFNLVFGPTPTNFNGEVEWETNRKAQSRYQRLPGSGVLTFSGYNAASWDYTTPIPFNVPMAKTPSISIATAFSLTNANTPVVTALDRNLWQIAIQQNTGSPAAWQAINGVVVAEANPS